MLTTPTALLRYQAISAYLALDLPRGKRGPILRQLASKAWTLPDGRQVHFSAETLRSWIRRYRAGGLAALEDKPRPQRGGHTLTPELVELFCKLKREVPERSLDRLLLIAGELGYVAPGTVSRSTLHRTLQAHELSGRPKPSTTVTDLDRFEASAANELWQSDMLVGPWLPDPSCPGKMRRAYLYAFLDDHSRLLLAARFSFRGDLPALELVFRQALRRHGVPRRVYYDNGATYRSKHMEQVVAALGVHRLIFTTPYRPQGHGKIEAFNRLCRSAFIAEVAASSIDTLEGLNAALIAWAERFYNRRLHAETRQTPHERWRAAIDKVRHLDEEVLRRAFLWSETRKTDKTGIFSLHGQRYQVGAELANAKVELRYDPEHLDELEVWRSGRFAERVRPFEVQNHRRPTVQRVVAEPTAEPTADWLGHLVAQRQAGLRDDPEAELRHALAERAAFDDAVVDILAVRLDDAVMDEAIVRTWLDHFGPITPEAVADLLDLALPTMGRGLHVQIYLDMIHAALLERDA